MAVSPPKKDFAGKTKTSKTYDADWVFSKNEGAWVTKDQARQAHEEDLRAKAEKFASLAPPPPPPAEMAKTAPPISTVPIVGTPVPTEPVPGVPSWWIDQAIKDPKDDAQKFANVANALLPTLAPEDQRTLASYLATNFRDVYGGYNNVNFGTAPTEITDAIRKQFLSPGRAQTALSLLDRMKTASGVADMGTGYDFLKNAVGLINQFAPNGDITRENYQQFTAAISGLTSQLDKALTPYGNLAQLFNLPNFTAGPLISNAPNARLFS